MWILFCDFLSFIHLTIISVWRALAMRRQRSVCVRHGHNECGAGLRWWFACFTIQFVCTLNCFFAIAAVRHHRVPCSIAVCNHLRCRWACNNICSVGSHYMVTSHGLTWARMKTDPRGAVKLCIIFFWFYFLTMCIACVSCIKWVTRCAPQIPKLMKWREKKSEMK